MSEQRIKELVEIVTHHNKQYWELDESEISDADYDFLKRELEHLDPENDLLTKIDDSAFEWGTKVIHNKPMLSLDKVFSLEEILTWATKVSRNSEELFDIQLKYDGAAGKLNQTTNQLVTRGDGIEGVDVSDKMPIIDIESSSNDTELLGEIIFNNNSFEYYKINNKTEKTYKNSRNAIGGILRTKNISEVDPSIQLVFVDHESVSDHLKLKELENDFNEVTANLLADMDNYPSDGIVIKLHDREYSESLGATGHHPRGAIAYKFPDAEYPTKLIDVIWQSGKRKLTPVAIVEPVDIDGATVSRVSLHNALNVITKDIKINDTVYIKRSGSVIPYITKREKADDRQAVNVDCCPICNHAVKYVEPELYCTNTFCLGNIKKQLSESVKTLGIEELGYPTVEKMVDTLGIKTVSDILLLEWEDIESLDGYAAKSADKLYSNINTLVANGVSDYLILASLNIKGIGKTLSKQLLAQYDIYELIELDQITLSTLDNMGPERSTELVNGISEFYDELTNLLEIINVVETKGQTAENLTSICFSGKFSKKKSVLEDKARSMDYDVWSTVKKDLDVLVTAGATTTKVTKARKLGVKVITEDEFLSI